MKEFNDQLLKFKVTNDKLKMEISLKDLVFLFENSENNVADIEPITIKRGKRQEFAEYFVEHLQDYSVYNDNDTRWGIGFEEVFNDIFESSEDFAKYPEDDED